MMELRVVDYGPGDAAENMSMDRRIMDSMEGETDQALFRWYQWRPPAFSIGYGQGVERALDPAKLRRHGVEAVKRPTGGALVFHGGDLSYSLLLPRAPRDTSSAELYAFVSGALIDGLGRLGVVARRPTVVSDARATSGDLRQVCLAYASPGDLISGERKLGGAAQRRFPKYWLQQGFILLRPLAPPDCFVNREVADRALKNCVDLAALGCRAPLNRVVDVLSAAVSKQWKEWQEAIQNETKDQ